MNLPSGISPRDELESRVLAMLLGEADDFETIELEGMLSQDPSLQVFRDEMARSIDVVGEAAVSIGPVGGTAAPKLSPSRRQEIEHAWSGGGSASAKTATALGPLAKLQPLLPLLVAAGVGVVTGTALVTFNSDDNSGLPEVSQELAGSVDGTGKVKTPAFPSDFSKRSVFDIPENVGEYSQPKEGIENAEKPGFDLDAGKDLLDRELRNLEPVAEHGTDQSRLELSRRHGDFKFDAKERGGTQKEGSSGSTNPSVFDLGPPNAIGAEDASQVTSNGIRVSPVPNASVTFAAGRSESPESKNESSSLSPHATAEAHSSVDPIAVIPTAGGKAGEKRELLARHVTIATYKGAPFRLCRGRTARCPKDCGSSGEFASFAIEQYLEYEKPGKYGSSKQASHLVQVSDFHRKPVGDPEILKMIGGLKEGDHVLLAWNHEYVTSKGSSAPDRPIKGFRKLTEEEETQYFPLRRER
ncbi:MAG: hypothetical protein VCA36_12085 [Opitutales bacterium]